MKKEHDFSKNVYENVSRTSCPRVPRPRAAAEMRGQDGLATRGRDARDTTDCGSHTRSKGTRGKFYQAKVRLNLPVYLDPDVQRFVEQIAHAQRSDVSRVVNQLLKSDMRLAKAMQ